MLRWITLLLLTIGLFATAIGCEQVVREPGEMEHGGPFLHSEISAPTTRY